MGRAQKKSCTGTLLLKEYSMKKILLATLLLLLLASTNSFAATTDNFTVTTTVAEIGLMKITTASIGTNNTLTAYNGLTDFTNYGVSGSGAKGTVAYLTTLSNKRTGYNVTMSASAMTSPGTPITYIKYTVTCNGVQLAPSGATALGPVGVLTVSNLSSITGSSKAITLTIDPTTYDAAASGTYTGTVTFTFTAT